MSRYHKYGVLSEVRLTQLDETINQLNTIKYPTRQLRELKEHLTWIKNDFARTIERLNNEGKIYNKIYEKHNEKNFQLQIDFI